MHDTHQHESTSNFKTGNSVVVMAGSEAFSGRWSSGYHGSYSSWDHAGSHHDYKVICSVRQQEWSEHSLCCYQLSLCGILAADSTVQLLKYAHLLLGFKKNKNN